MQAKQFDSLFNENWLDAQAALFPVERKERRKLLLNEDKLQSYVEDNQEPIPEQMNSDIQALINHRRNIGDSEANIKRLVKKIFHITIV